MTSSIYNSIIPIWKSGSRKGKSKQWIQNDNKWQTAPTKNEAKKYKRVTKEGKVIEIQ